MKEENINSAAQAYCDAIYGTLKTNQVDYDAFKEGTKFVRDKLRNTLWYDVSKIPEPNKYIMVTWKDEPGLFCLKCTDL